MSEATPAPDTIAVTDRESAVLATAALVTGSRRRIRILSRVLDPGQWQAAPYRQDEGSTFRAQEGG